jgi:hypothetical protein
MIMEEIVSAQWTDDKHETIAVTLRGATVMNAEKSAEHDPEGETVMFVPDDMTNRHRQELAEWEATGNTIADPPEDAD